MSTVTLFTRKGCCLCDDAKEVLRKARKKVAFALEEIDIDTDAQLRSQYNDEVPVIAIDGRKAFKYRVDLQEFLRKLSARI